jgi:uncharacterized protein YaiL (DUF2058 family)
VGNALQEQLLKAGLVDKNQANRAKNAKHKKLKQQRQKNEAVVDEAKLLAQKAMEEKAQRAKELNRQKEEMAKQKAIVAQIRQLIELNRISKGNGDDRAYNFSDNNVVKKIYVIEDVHDALSDGKMAIVKLDGQYEVVPAPVADKISQRDSSAVIVRNDPNEKDESEDDFYADYQIPDDLMW